MYAEVIVDIAHASVDRLFTYEVPEDLPVVPGHRVLVPFGAGNRRTEGFVLSTMAHVDSGDYQIKRIIKTMEPYPVLFEEQIRLAYWIKSTYRCFLVDALRLMIPAQLRGGKVREKRVRTFSLALPEEEARAALLKKDGTPRSVAQMDVLEYVIQSGGKASAELIAAFVPDSAAAVRALVKKGVFEEYGTVTFRTPYRAVKPDAAQEQPKVLTSAQAQACKAILSCMDKREGTVLLHGVTGSGKTEVYMHAISQAMAQGGSAIVLVPEISLTPQTVASFRSRFGDKVAVLHSRLGAGERYDEWRRIRLGKVSVVVGARSAVFAPLGNLRLIIIDEEHEPSYISETSPRYSALETAAKRCALCGAVLVLGSATPSLQTYRRALGGRYKLLELPERVNGIPMPNVNIVDMRDEFASGNNGIFSAALHARLRECLDAGEQAILFINRRGYSTFVSCRGCGYVFKCPDCDVSMTYHKQDNQLKCHYCGRTMRVPKVCSECGKPYVKYFGIGTQQVEEQLLGLFPNTLSVRMDTDTTRGKNAHYELLSRFTSGQAQVLIGTQMIAKGLDIPNVTLVGVIAADATLHIPDYRSAERTFQLLTQVAGRAGRDAKPGNVVIQTYTPDHPAIQFAARHDYQGFYEGEIALRRAALFPPFSLFLRVLFAGDDEAELIKLSEAYCAALNEAVSAALEAGGGDRRELLFIFASSSPIRRKQGVFRYQVLLKLARTKHTPLAVNAVYDYLEANRSPRLAAVEINPQNLF